MTYINQLGRFAIGILTIGVFTTLIKSKKKNPICLSSEEASKILSGSSMPKSALDIIRYTGRATQLRRQAKYDEALRIIKRIYSAYPDRPEILAWASLEKGLSLIQKGDFLQAKAALEYALTLKDHDTTGLFLHSVQYELSKVYARTGEVDLAISALREAIAGVPHSEKAEIRKEQMRNRLGEYYIIKGDFAEAKKVLEDVLQNQIKLYGTEIHDEVLITLLKLAEAYSGLKNNDKALEILSRAEAIHSKIGKKELYSNILFLKGKCIENSEPETAKKYFAEALEIENL